MASVNKVILIGHLGKDPELRQVGQTQVCTLRLATSERFKDRDGNPQEKTEWHQVVAWGGLADSCSKYLRKGRQIYVEGQLQTREWSDKDGVKRYTTEIRADEVTFLGDGGQQGGGEQRPQSAPAPAPAPPPPPPRRPAQTSMPAMPRQARPGDPEWMHDPAPAAGSDEEI